MRGNSDAQKGAACSYVSLYSEGSNASSTDNELWRVENSFLRMRGNSKRSEGSGMLIGDPLGEGSNASSTNSELWEAEDSSFSAQKGAACS